ncbi:MAG: Mur ligase family protein, partial [Candidatus Berkelbacteria bacterium]
MPLKKIIKNKLYFAVAKYFLFFASIRLRKWNPRVVVVTGSNGKTTTVEMIKAQLGDKIKFSDEANSTYGIPFDILGLRKNNYNLWQWIGTFLLAPSRIFTRPFSEKIYLVEADCDRPGEGYYLSRLLNPELTVWLSSDRTHSQNYDKKVNDGEFPDV